MDLPSLSRALRRQGLTADPSALQELQSSPAPLPQLLAALKRELQRRGQGCKADLLAARAATSSLASGDGPAAAYPASSTPFVAGVQAVHVVPAFRPNTPLHAPAEARAGLLRARLEMVKDRVMRNHRFAGGAQAGAQVVLTPVDALVAGAPPPKGMDAHFVMGVITRTVDEAKFWLEDLTGKVPLDLSRVVHRGNGLYVEGCIVIAIGHFLKDGEEESHHAAARGLLDADLAAEEDEHRQARGAAAVAVAGLSRYALTAGGGVETAVFRVNTIMMPPPEDRAESERAFPGLSRQVLGLPPLTRQEREEFRAAEVRGQDAFFIVASEVHLDEGDTMRALKQVLDGFSETPPTVFVMMGNFTSKPFGYDKTSTEQCSPEEYAQRFEDLGELIAGYPRLAAETHFVFVPGPCDPTLGGATLLPRPALFKTLTKRFSNKLPPGATVTFSTNPCRLVYYTQEIVLFREDLISKMRRNCVVPPREGRQVTEDLTSTMIDQAHLSPLSFHTCPRFTAHDSGLHLFPVPDVIILADHYDQFERVYKGCSVSNPGSFSSDASFIVYRPSDSTVEFSRLSSQNTNNTQQGDMDDVVEAVAAEDVDGTMDLVVGLQQQLHTSPTRPGPPPATDSVVEPISSPLPHEDDDI